MFNFLISLFVVIEETCLFIFFAFHSLGRKLCGNWYTNVFVALWSITGTSLFYVYYIIPTLVIFIKQRSDFLSHMQYLKHYRPFRDIPIFERFPVLICVTIVWIYSVILTAGGAYRHRPMRTQINCRTDRANLISSAPWLSIWNLCLFFYMILGHIYGLAHNLLVPSTGSSFHILCNGVHQHLMLVIQLL